MDEVAPPLKSSSATNGAAAGPPALICTPDGGGELEFTVQLNEAEPLAPVVSVAVTVTFDVPAVVGVPDASWGEVVCAVVVGAPGHPAPTEAEIRERCRAHLASFKQPRRVEVVDAIPRTPATGQVQRRLLVERLSRG